MGGMDMEIEKKCIKKVMAGFLGNRFYIARYSGDYFLTTFEKKELLLESCERINDLSVWEYDQYITEVSLDDVEDIYQCKMYATYKGNEYEVMDVGPEFTSIQLKARRDKSKNILIEDRNLGFEYDPDYRFFYKIVTLEDLDDIRVERHSVKEEFQRKYSEQD